jgi:hypothetical protein
MSRQNSGTKRDTYQMAQMQALLRERIRMYLILSGPRSVAIKDFIAGEITRNLVLSDAPQIISYASKPLVLEDALERREINATAINWAVSIPF